MNLASLLAANAREFPDRPALVDHRHGEDRIVSFRDLSDHVAAGAGALRRHGLKPGQTILVFQPVSIELYEFLLAAFHAGMRVMLADPSAGRRFLSLCCQRLAPDAFFGSWKAHLLGLTVPEIRRIPLRVSADWFPLARRWQADGDPLPLAEVSSDEPALVTFTSGSTGLPKAAVRSHGFLLAQHATLSKALDFQPGEVDLITLPVFVLANLASGLTSVLAATDLAKPGSPDITAVTRQCGKFRVTRCAASPAFFEAFLASESGLPRFGKLYTGGARVFPDLLRRLRSSLPAGAIVHSVYGSTEAEPIAHLSADDADEATAETTRQGGGVCSGIPVPEICLRIIMDQWGTPLGPMSSSQLEDICQAPGQAGEIIVSGAHVLRGYLEGTGDGETKIHVDGTVWHRTGDAGWLDAQGRVWLLGRASEKLPPAPSPAGLPAEALLYPFAIECALREILPDIPLAALEWQGQRVLVTGQKPRTSRLSALRTAGDAFGIQRIIHLSSLPMDKRHNAKIDYPALRAMLAAEA